MCQIWKKSECNAWVDLLVSVGWYELNELGKREIFKYKYPVIKKTLTCTGQRTIKRFAPKGRKVFENVKGEVKSVLLRDTRENDERTTRKGGKKRRGYYSRINCVEGVRAMHTKRPRGKTNYSNGLQCLYLPCKWCIQRIGYWPLWTLECASVSSPPRDAEP